MQLEWSTDMKDHNEKLLDQYSDLIKKVEPVAERLKRGWDINNKEYVRRFMQFGEAGSLHLTPLYNTSINSPSSQPDLIMVEVSKNEAVLVYPVYSAEDVRKQVVGVIEKDIVTLMNTHYLKYNDVAHVFCQLFGGDIRTDTTNYPFNPSRLHTKVDGVNKEYGLSDGMQIQIADGKGKVITYQKDKKIRSNRRVTSKVNKLFKEYMDGAYALAKLMEKPRPANSRWDWNEEEMTSLAQLHLGVAHRVNWDSRLDSIGLVNNPQRYVVGDFAVSIGEDSTISVKDKHGVIEKIITAARNNDFAPMAYLLLENGKKVEKRILNAVRMAEGGFYIGE